MIFHAEVLIRSPGDRERGATLIVVMLVLIVLTVLGVSAMRMGLSNLNVATNSQVGNLLYQSSDAGLVYLIKLDPIKAAAPGGALASLSTPGKEDVFCLRMKGAAPSLKSGTCDSTQTADFLSSRNAVMTQLYVKSKDAITLVEVGNDLATPSQVFTLTSTSVLPGFGSATAATISDCLAKPGDDTVKETRSNNEAFEYEDPAVVSSSECLASNGAIFTTLVEDVRVVRVPE